VYATILRFSFSYAQESETAVFYATADGAIGRGGNRAKRDSLPAGQPTGWPQASKPLPPAGCHESILNDPVAVPLCGTRLAERGDYQTFGHDFFRITQIESLLRKAGRQEI